MAITAQGPVRDPGNGFRYVITEGDKGWEGEKNYLVNTDLEDLAILAAGLPAIGEPWSAEIPECQCYKRGPVERMGGKDTDGSGAAGWCRVPIFYRSPTAASFAVPTETRAWTELRSVSGTTTIQYPIGSDAARRRRASAVPNPPGGPGFEVQPPYAKIGNGDGASIFVGGVEARVHRWVKFDEPYNYARLIGLTRPAKLNAESIVLPRINDQPQSFSIGPRQALYTAFEVNRAGQYQEIVHVLQLAEDWLVRWQPENDKGEGQAIFYFDEVYTDGDFAGLWP